MPIDLSKLQDSIKLEIKKADLLAFADKLREQHPNQSEDSTTKDILLIDDVAELLGLARQTIYGLCSRRAIPHFKRNTRLYFKRSQIIKWIEEGKKKTQVEFDEDVANYISKNQRKK